MAWSVNCQRISCAFIVASFFVVVMVLIFNSTQRLKLCENGDELFHEETGKCYKNGDKGPCDDTLILSEQDINSPYGGCSCAYKENLRTLLYHKETNKCYFVFSQAFCEEGFWLNVTHQGEPFCSENKCLKDFPKEEGEIVPLKNGKCAVLQKPTEGCEGNEVIQFYRHSVFPSCKNRRRKLLAASITVNHYPCPVGSFRNILGKCQPEIDIDFS